MKNKKVAVLISGGLDSAILLDQLHRSYTFVQPLYVASGHFWEQAERFWLKKYLNSFHSKRIKPLLVLSMKTRDLYGHHWSITGGNIPGSRSHDEKVYLPGKNLLLIVKASVFCALNKIPNLALAPLKTNPFPDARASFFRELQQVCSQALNFKIKIMAPFLNKTKQHVMKLGIHLPLEFTFSCLSPVGRLHCGKCNKCAERKKAFRIAHIDDPTRYAN